MNRTSKALRLLRGLLVLCVVTSATWGCAESESRPAEEPGQTAVIGNTASLEGLNDATNHAVATNTHLLHQLFLTLVKESPDFFETAPTFEPHLAESWEWSDDRLALTFHIRPEVVWSDGHPVTAEDVRFTWDAHNDPDVAWESLSFKSAIRDVEVVDPLTVRFHFSRIDSMGILHANEGVILPKHAWGRLPFDEWRQSAPWFRDNLVTNGPFRLESWSPGDELVLVKNPTYYKEDRPRLERVVVRQVPDQSALVTRLLAGDLDFAQNIPPEAVPRLAASDRVEVLEYWGIGYIYFAWNHDLPQFRDARVRRALTYGIDRQGIVDALWGDYARVGISPVVQAVWAHNDDLTPYGFDPAKARELLAEAGWRDSDDDGVVDKDGEPLRFVLTVHSGNNQRQDAAVIAQQQLAEIGIGVELELMDFSTFVEAVDAGRFDAYIAGLNMGTDLDLTYLLHSGQIEEGLNHTRYRNPEADRLLDEINRQPDLESMKERLDRLQVLIHRDQPMTFLWESKRIQAVSRRLRGAKPNVISPYANLEEWWIEPPP